MDAFDIPTLIEFYDASPVCNLLASSAFSAGRVIFLCGAIPDEFIRAETAKFIKKRSPGTSVYFHACDMDSPDAILRLLRRFYAVCGALTIELTGGGESAAFAAGVYVTEKRSTGSDSVISYDFGLGRFAMTAGRVKLPPEREIRFTVRELFAVSGGIVEGYGRIPPERFDDGLCADIMSVWEVFSRRSSKWSEFAAYLQYVTNTLQKTRTDDSGQNRDSLSITAPQTVRLGGEVRRGNLKILRSLYRAGILTDFSYSDGVVSFRYKNDLMRRFLCDAGIWLELYCYVMAKKADCFDDFAQSVLVRWNRSEDGAAETTNELDFVATRGIRSLFVSCKLGAPQTSALNEIRTLTDRFAGGMGRAALVTMSDLSDSPFTAARARELGITLIGGSGLYRLDEIFKSMFKPK